MIRSTASWLGCLVLATLFLLSGCFSRGFEKVNYFSLLRMGQLAEIQNMSRHPELSLGIGPVSLPDSLQRTQIVTRRNGNQFEFNEYNRWAGTLEDEVAATIGDNLSQLLGTDSIDYFPWPQYFRPNYRLVIDLERFDGDLDGEAVLRARWRIIGADGKEVLSVARNSFSQKLSDHSYTALVAAESQLVVDLSKVIAAEIKRLFERG